MISFLEGKIILKRDNFLIVEVGGVGYKVFLSRSSLQRIAEKGENIKLFCYLDIGERSLKLYGFLTFEELEFFEILRNISGVGPKASLEIVSLGKVEEVKKEIEKGNVKFFVDIPGIGAKKAKKIILELSGKLKALTPPLKKEKFPEDEVFLALLNLGFKKEAIKDALSQLPKGVKDAQERIKYALKILGE
ncbi:Holliday junction branch migration protein RuvA [bacterium]|nr:Holliday junction branch migration protein RuvA [bacterium]